MSGDITCKQFVDFLMAYLDGEVSDEERAVVDQHMELCPPCITYLETYRETIRLGKLCADPEGPVPADAPDDLVRAVLAARARD